MGKTFVYNSGNPQPADPGTLKLCFGMFFDGTRNNLQNTEIRKKVERKGEFQNIPASDDERSIFEKYAKDDNSFGNDFTNVARKYMCTRRDEYSLYVEGIATIDKAADKGDGFKYGRGETGVVGKVRKGCIALANKIYESKKKDTEIIEVTLDIFGFSRGAAAARNFAYNLQLKAYPPNVYYPPVQGADKILVDHETSEFKTIKNNWVQDGLLPQFGHLGTSLLEAGLGRELVDTMIINVRFIGIYDTVASYDPTCLLLPSFKEKIKELHLHDLGSPKKAVHFTAADEHRKNFSLTRFSPITLKSGVEKNFPGVHSDVGGSYNHDALTSKEIADKAYAPDTTEGLSEYESVWLEKAYFSSSLEKTKNELIEEGWFTEDQLKIGKHINYHSFIGSFNVLSGNRYLYKGYSFIPLHFMCDYALPYVNEDGELLFYSKLMSDYTLNDPFLDDVKAYLKQHVIDNNENWNIKGNFRHNNDDKNSGETSIATTVEKENEVAQSIPLEEVVITSYKSDYMLRKLRNRYLHRSARINNLYDALAYEPNDNRIRMEFL